VSSTGISFEKLSAYNYVPGVHNIFDPDGGSAVVWFLVKNNSAYFLFKEPSNNIPVTSYVASYSIDYNNAVLNEIFYSDVNDSNISTLGIYYNKIDNGLNHLNVDGLSSLYVATTIPNFVIPSYANPYISVNSGEYSIISSDVKNYKYKHIVLLAAAGSLVGGTVSGDPNLYYISNGAQTPLPGYFSGKNLLSISPTQLYILTESSCK